MTEIRSSLAYIVGWYIVAPERTYEFDAFLELEEVTKVAMKALFSFRSTNENANSRKRTNTGQYRIIAAFLSFLIQRKNDGYEVGFDIASYHAYEQMLRKNYSPITEVFTLNTMRRVFKFAIDTGFVERFPMPRNAPQSLAMATSRGGATLADQVRSLPTEIKNRVELNSILMEQLHAFCWKRIHEIRDRFERGNKWRSEYKNSRKTATQTFDEAPMTLPREMSLRLIVETIWAKEDGFLPIFPETGRSLSKKEKNGQELRRSLYKFITRGPVYETPITIDEISDYLNPSHRQIAAFLPVFAMKGINSFAITELETSMLLDSPLVGASEQTIYWKKYRSNRELKTGPFKRGGKDSQTIPRAWEILLTVTEAVRRAARPEEQKLLFLCFGRRKSKERPRGIYPASNNFTMKIFNDMVRQESNVAFGMLNKIEGSISLKGIRTTAANIRAYRQGIIPASELLNHKDTSTTVGYLNNNEYKSHLDDFIEKGQALLLAHLKEKPLLVAENPKNIMEVHGLSSPDANALAADHYNTGYGVSLLNEKAYIVDTPLNYLRMLGWLRKIETAEERLASENPIRFKSYWMPQIALFKSALDDFPRKTRLLADKTKAQYNLLYPDPH